MPERKERFKLIAAVYLFFVEDNKILLLRRSSTGYEDGNYSVPAGHLDGNESLTASAAREGNEETGTIINPRDIQLIHTMHRLGKDERLDFFFLIKNWTGEPENTEPEKCDDLSWFPLNNLPQNTIPYIKTAIENYISGKPYSEFGWS
jgi:ADP-ribose pyrophosphatase YjhB (NUDIX family)